MYNNKIALQCTIKKNNINNVKHRMLCVKTLIQYNSI